MVSGHLVLSMDSNLDAVSSSATFVNLLVGSRLGSPRALLQTISNVQAGGCCSMSCSPLHQIDTMEGFFRSRCKPGGAISPALSGSSCPSCPNSVPSH